MEQQRQVGEHFLVQDASGAGTGDRLAVYHNAARAVGLLDNAYGSVVALSVIKQAAGFLHFRLEEDAVGQKIQCGARGQQHQTGNAETERTERKEWSTGRSEPGEHPDQETAADQDEKRGLDAQARNEEEPCYESARDAAQRIDGVDAAEPATEPARFGSHTGNKKRQTQAHKDRGQQQGQGGQGQFAEENLGRRTAIAEPIQPSGRIAVERQAGQGQQSQQPLASRQAPPAIARPTRPRPEKKAAEDQAQQQDGQQQ